MYETNTPAHQACIELASTMLSASSPNKEVVASRSTEMALVDDPSLSRSWKFD